MGNKSICAYHSNKFRYTIENSGGVSEAAERARGYSSPEGPGGFPLPAQGGELHVPGA